MESPSLMDLNDDCLESVLQYFKLQDLVEIRGLCPRLDAVSERFRRKFVHFKLYEHSFLTKENIVKVLQFLGPKIKSLDCYAKTIEGLNNTDLLGYIGTYCTNLEKLALRGFDPETVDTYAIYQLMTPNLKSITFGTTTLSSDFNGDFFENAPNLEEMVYATGNQRNIMTLFKRNLNLKSLEFYSNLEPKYVKHALKYSLNLEKLIFETVDVLFVSEFFQNYCPLDSALVQYISKNLTNITELTFAADDDSFNLLPFGDLPKLIKLTIRIHYLISDFDPFLQKLVDKNIIEELHIKPNGSQIYYQDMNFELLGKLINLKKFSLHYYDTIFNDDLKHLQNLQKLESLSIRLPMYLECEGLLELVASNQNLKYLDAYSDAIKSDFLKPLIDVLKKTQDRPKLEFRGFDYEDYGDKEELSKILKENEKIIIILKLHDY